MTLEELKAETDRRAAALALAAAERQRILDRQAREAAELERLQEENRKKSERAEYVRRIQEAEYALSAEGQLLAMVKDLTAASKSTADSVRQIRNLIAATMIFWTIVFILAMVLRSV